VAPRYKLTVGQFSLYLCRWEEAGRSIIVRNYPYQQLIRDKKVFPLLHRGGHCATNVLLLKKAGRQDKWVKEHLKQSLPLPSLGDVTLRQQTEAGSSPGLLHI